MLAVSNQRLYLLSYRLWRQTTAVMICLLYQPNWGNGFLYRKVAAVMIAEYSRFNDKITADTIVISPLAVNLSTHNIYRTQLNKELTKHVNTHIHVNIVPVLIDWRTVLLLLFTSDKGGGIRFCLRTRIRLSVCLCARLLKNVCMDLDEMLRVDRCRVMGELITIR